MSAVVLSTDAAGVNKMKNSGTSVVKPFLVVSKRNRHGDWTGGLTSLYFKEVIFTSVRRRGWKKTLEIL